VNVAAYAVLALAIVLAIIFLFGDRPATTHPLLVDAAIRESNEPVIPWRLYSHCPVDRRNVPYLEDRSA
jgi:hypothetical protein